MGSYEPAVFPDGAPAPLQLIAYDSDTGLVECGQEALACLRSIKTPVGVIAVTGRARTGKSYILNQLLGQSTGFKLAHSHRPCTKGLWIWSQPFQRVGPDGNPYHLVSGGVQQLQRGIVRAHMHSMRSSTSRLRVISIRHGTCATHRQYAQQYSGWGVLPICTTHVQAAKRCRCMY